MPENIEIEKELLFKQHTLEETYKYKNISRCFQWDKIKEGLSRIESLQRVSGVWGILQNRYNKNGKPPAARNARIDNRYQELIGAYGVEDTQSIPLYTCQDKQIPERYGRDGSLVRVTGKNNNSLLFTVAGFDGEWLAPSRYIQLISPAETPEFRKAVFVDRTHQNVATLEKIKDKWLIRSMNPATTGIYKPPHRRITPVGIFVIQEKKERMHYLIDGTDEIEGFALYANRFSNGGYLHGVAVAYPETEAVEFCPSLGTTPQSHMCVRNATSHAKFIYDWAPIQQTLLYVIE